MDDIGRIVRLQVQRVSLKVGERRRERYSPAGIVAVPTLLIGPEGVEGRDAAGTRIADVHHARHPQTAYRGENPLSLALTGTYAAMRERFGPHLLDGIAGENILVASDGPLPHDRPLAFVTATGETIALHDVIAATPCAPFSTFALDAEAPAPQDLKAALQWLDGGGRGWYMRVESAASLSPGDRLVAL